MWPTETPASLNTFYGSPDRNGDGRPDPIWEATSIIDITPPYSMVLAWNPAVPVSRIAINRKCSDSLLRVLTNIRSFYGSQEAIEAAGLHLYGGAYMFRLMRGSARLSVHSWGAAIDLDPGHNQFGNPKFSMNADVVRLFEAEGWTWGGRWSKPDAMHFQAADL